MEPLEHMGLTVVEGLLQEWLLPPEASLTELMVAMEPPAPPAHTRLILTAPPAPRELMGLTVVEGLLQEWLPAAAAAEAAIGDLEAPAARRRMTGWAGGERRG